MSASETQVVQKDSLNWANKISCPQLATRFVRRMRGRRGAVVGVPLTATKFSYSNGGGGPLSCFIWIGVPLIEFFFHAAVSQFETNEQRKVLQSKNIEWLPVSVYSLSCSECVRILGPISFRLLIWSVFKSRLSARCVWTKTRRSQGHGFEARVGWYDIFIFFWLPSPWGRPHKSLEGEALLLMKLSIEVLYNELLSSRPLLFTAR